MGDDKDASHSKNKKEKHKDRDRDRDREKSRRDGKGERDDRHDARRESQKVCSFLCAPAHIASSCLHVPCQPGLVTADPVLHQIGASCLDIGLLIL